VTLSTKPFFRPLLLPWLASASLPPGTAGHRSSAAAPLPHFTGAELLSYTILGVVCGLAGIVYGRSIHFLRDLFERARIPNWTKPAVGGFLVGLIGVFLPQVLGMGYGWLQFAINGDFASLPVTVMLVAAAIKILTTGLTVGSGGSGGYFAPALVVGGMTGGVLWSTLNNLPAIITPDSPSAFVIVAMMALFGGIAKVPLAMILMVTEMTMDYKLLIPSMLACSIAYFVTKDYYLFENQVDARWQSPAHRHEYSTILLKTLKVDRAMTVDMPTISPISTVDEVVDLLERYEVHAVSVVDEGRLVGIVTKLDALMYIPHGRSEVKEIMNPKLIVTYPDESLFEAMNKMIINHISQLPVVERNKPDLLIGLLTIEDVTAVQCSMNAGKNLK